MVNRFSTLPVTIFKKLSTWFLACLRILHLPFNRAYVFSVILVLAPKNKIIVMFLLLSGTAPHRKTKHLKFRFNNF